MYPPIFPDSKPSTSASANSIPGDVNTTEDDDDDEVEFVSETDAERRQALLESEVKDGDRQAKLGSSKDSWKTFMEDFNFGGGGDSSSRKASGSKGKTSIPLNEIIDIPSDGEEDVDTACDVPVASGSTFTTGSWNAGTSSNSVSKGKGKATVLPSTSLGLGKMVQTEIDLRKKESIGMAPVKGGGRKLGAKPKPEPEFKPPEMQNDRSPSAWSCLVCTL